MSASDSHIYASVLYLYQPSLADVLLGMGAIPSGFRSSTLAKLVHEHEGTQIMK